MSVRSLTELNRNLIRSAVVPQTEEGGADDDALGSFIGGTGQTITVVPVDEGPGSWSTADPFEYRQTRDWLRSQVFGGSFPTGMETFVTAFVRGWGEKVFEESGGEEGGGEWPTLASLLARDDFVNGVTWLPFIQARLPSVFTTEGEDGSRVMATSDPLTGVTFATLPDPGPLASAIQEGGEAAQAPVRRDETGAINQAQGDRIAMMGEQGVGPTSSIAGAAQGTPGGIPSQAGPQSSAVPQTIQDLIRENPELKSAGRTGIPHISGPDLSAMLQQVAGGGGGRGGGGGGGGRRELVFDRAHLMSQVERRYEEWLFEGAPEEQVSRIVDAYVREASGFWSRKGGQLDFDTFVNDRLRGLPRYKMIFRHKPESITEGQYVTQFAQPIAQLGLRPDTTRTETVAALTSGGSAAEQLRRVGRTREAQGSRAFSKELASTLSGLGAAARFG